MANVRESFDQFLRGLELTASEQETASRQQNDLRARLRNTLRGVVRDVLVGSYARRTAIRPLNDIDLFVELDVNVWRERRAAQPLLLLEDVQRALRACYPGSPPATRIQGRSVNIDFAGTGIGYDIIPAFLVPRTGWSTDDIYEIPDRKRQTWIRTNPESHRLACVAANARAGSKLNPLIKAAKCWNRGQANPAGDKPLCSFHLEVMAYSAFVSPPADVRRGLLDLLRSLRVQIQWPCPEPAGLGPAVDADWTRDDRARAAVALDTAVATAERAIEYESRGQHAQACETWRSLLGSTFPL